MTVTTHQYDNSGSGPINQYNPDRSTSNFILIGLPIIGSLLFILFCACVCCCCYRRGYRARHKATSAASSVQAGATNSTANTSTGQAETLAAGQGDHDLENGAPPLYIPGSVSPPYVTNDIELESLNSSIPDGREPGLPVANPHMST